MLRSTLKIPNQGLTRLQRPGSSRPLSAGRCRQPQNSYSTESSGGRRGGGGGKALFYTVGFVSLTAGGTIAYAKYDPEFRKLLTTQAPWADTVIKVVLQEEETLNEKVSKAVEKVTSAVDSVSGAVGKVQEGYRSILGLDEKEGEREVKKESPVKKTEEKITEKKEEKITEKKDESLQGKLKAFSSVLSFISGSRNPPPDKSSWKEIRKVKNDKGKADTQIVSSDKPPERREDSANVEELEKKISQLAHVAVKAYEEATAAVREKHNEILKLMEQTAEETDERVWQQLKKKTEQSEKALKKAEERASVALNKVNKLRKVLEEQELKAPDHIKLVNRVINVTDEVSRAQEEFEREKQKSTLADQYSKKVYEARQHYLDEIQILFPNFRIDDKQWRVSKDDLDLFIYHCYRNVLHYQKELAKLETYGEERLRSAINQSGGEVQKDLVEALVAEEIDKQRRILEVEFQKRRLEVERTVQKELKQQLKRQSEAHVDHLNDAVAVREKELEREFVQKQNELLTGMQDKFKYQLAGMMGRLQGLEASLKARARVDKAAHQAQALWSACQALHFSLRHYEPGVPWEEQLKPLDKEIKAVKKAASEEDNLVKVVLCGIPIEAMCRGVYSEAALRDRFLKVEKVARRLALVPEEGASLPVYLLSFIQSCLLIKSVNPIPQSEIRDQPTEFSCLDTYDILQRAQYWMERGNIDQTLRYMNLLRGASRSIASDWMNEARIYLETMQAANVLMTHAAASGLVYI